jgi:hypothetical protein
MDALDSLLVTIHEKPKTDDKTGMHCLCAFCLIVCVFVLLSLFVFVVVYCC